MPLLFSEPTANNGVVGVWAITESAAELEAILALDDDDRAKLYGFQRDARRCEWLASRVVLKHIVGHDVKIGYRANGAPYMANQSGYISLSHTKGFAAAVFHPTKPTGIDIEYPSARVLKVSDRFLSGHEMAFIPKEWEMVYQTVIWCAKEALFKWLGKTNVTFNTDLIIDAFTCQQNKPFRLNAKVGAEVPVPVSLMASASDDCVVVYID
jgi:4'-phosphopantetheinyl transferase